MHSLISATDNSLGNGVFPPAEHDLHFPWKLCGVYAKKMGIWVVPQLEVVSFMMVPSRRVVYYEKLANQARKGADELRNCP